MSSRIRMQGSFASQPITATQKYDGKVGSCTAPFTSNNSYWSGTLYDWQGEVRYMSDTVTPGFRSKVAKGEVFFSPMEQVISRINPVEDGSEYSFWEPACTSPNQYNKIWHYKNCARQWVPIAPWPRNGSDYAHGVVSTQWPISSSDRSALIGEAVTDCLNNRGRSENNLFETLAELDKSTRLLEAILGNARKAISRKRSLLERAKDSGSGYLAYRYGLKPIMADVEAVVKGLSKAVGRVRSTSRGNASLVKEQQSIATQAAWGNTTITVTTSFIETLQVRAMSLDEHVATLESNIGFTTKGLLTLPWELLPYSFVYDWFWNIGSYIGALVPAIGYTQRGSCYTIKDHVVVKKEITNTVFNGSTGGMISPWQAVKTAEEIRKTRFVTLPQPAIVTRANFGFDRLTRCADAAALLVQLLPVPVPVKRQITLPRGGKPFTGWDELLN